MKKLITLITLGLSLLVEPFTSQFKARNTEPLLANAATESTLKNKSRHVNSDLFDSSYYDSWDDVTTWTPDIIPTNLSYSNYNVEEGSSDEVNISMNARAMIGSNSKEDVLSKLYLSEDTDIPLSQFVINNNTGHTFLTNTDGEDYGFEYITCTPNIYIDTSIAKTQNISFYIGIYWDMDVLNDFLSKSPSLIGSEIVVFAANDYTFIKVKFEASGCYLYTDNYASIEPVVGSFLRKPLSLIQPSGGNVKRLMCKVTIPYVESIDKLIYLNTLYGSSDSGSKINESTNVHFTFDASMNGHYYFYFFDICSLSVLNSQVIIDHKNDYIYFSRTGEFPSDASIELISMNVIFNGSKKTLKKTTQSAFTSSIGPSSSMISKYDYSVIAPTEYTCTFTSSTNDDNLTYWTFTGLDFENNISGSIKIKSIKYNLTYKTTDNDGGEIEEVETFVNHYEYANIHKYSFSCDKGARTYYYKMNGYYRNAFKSWGLVTIIDGWIFNAFYNYQIFGFDFYFDKQKTMAIPNVQAITFKYQFGYSGPNPEEGSNGFYPNDPNDSHKDIHIVTYEVKPANIDSDFINIVLGINDLGGSPGVTYDAQDYMMTDDYGYKHDYIFYNARKRGTDYYSISAMDALEICYQSDAMETVRMVGNSLGLHVVTDDDGNMLVCDADGNPREEYGVYISEDGSLIPGIDEDGDGVISSDETINSDTGEKSYPHYTGNTNKPWSFNDWFNDLKDDWLTTFIRVVIIVVVAILVIKILPIIFTNKPPKRKKKRKK